MGLVPGDLLPFYCPALAWGGSRPWEAHRSRIFRARGQAASGAASSAGGPSEIVSTPGPVIEQLPETDWFVVHPGPATSMP